MKTTIQKRAKRPRYLDITERFRRQMEDGELKPGARLPSFTEMREQHGASQATMERVFALLEQDGLISREPGRGTFVSAGSQRVETGLIGFIGNEFTARKHFRYEAHIVDGIEEALHREERRILLLKRESTVGWDKVDGMLISDPNPKDVIARLPQGLPCVSLLFPAAGVASVLADDYGGARQAVEYLLSLGHRRIACLMQASAPLIRMRVAGYCDALQEAGIEPKPDWMREPRRGFDAEGYRGWGRDSMQEWLANGWQKLGCTALFVQNDLATIGAIEALQANNIQVPQQVSVMSFDGTELCDLFSPRISAVEVPLHQLGAVGIDILMQQIREHQAQGVTTILPTRLKLGESTASPS